MMNETITPELQNLVWSVFRPTEDGEVPSTKVEDVFWLQHTEDPEIDLSQLEDGIYPFYTYYGRVGELEIIGGEVIPESIDPWFDSFENDHIFIEGMTINRYGLINIWMGS